MSKSAIYTTNTSKPTIAVGGVVPVGVTTRRFGCNIKQDGNTITLCGQGYYLVNVSASVAPTVAGPVSLAAQKDGVAILGATATETAAAANDVLNLSIAALIRNACGCESSILSLILSGTEAVVENLAVTVEKL